MSISSGDDGLNIESLDLLETGYLKVAEFIVKKIAVIKLGVNDRGSNGRGS